MSRFIGSAAGLLVLMTTACAPSIQSASFQATLSPTRMEDVRVFTTRVPACEYEELGIVTSEPPNLFTHLQAVVDGMRRRAALMGGHALVELRPRSQAAAGSPSAGDGSSGGAGYLATVVRFSSPCSSP
ncbi:MAG: hypothetical protein H0X65_10615 [Gemmatimonadetes bacterium]|nr:hypothetical protein [Gemmatimonadota bacterium]